MKDKSTLLAIALAVVAVTLLAVSYFTKDSNTNSNVNKTYIVKNYSNFYTVNSCLYRVTTLISSKDSDDLLLVLHDDYKKNNKINKNNVLSIFPNVGENSTFVSRKMYYEDLSSNVRKFYVYGYIEENQLFDGEDIQKLDKQYAYFVVYLDSKNETFSVEPYSGEIFKKGDTNE